MSNDPGKIFEQNVKKSLEEQYFKVLRLVDSNKFGVNTRFTLKNPYDFECYSHPYNFVFECKSTKEDRLGFKRIDLDSKPSKDESVGTYMIKPHQVRGLYNASKTYGVVAGFLIEFRKEEYEHYFLPIDTFKEFMYNTNKKSINYSDVTDIAVRLNNHKSRVNYKIDFGNLWLYVEDKY